ncbi:MAG: sugar phosphate isomerase/epimerase family protein [Anaerolineae bacterium]
MKVGMDGMPIGSLLKIEDNPLLVMDHAIALGFEGVLLGNGPLRDEGVRRQVIAKAKANNLYVEMGGAGIDSALSGKTPKELAAGWKDIFPLAKEVGSPILVTGMGTWPWDGRIISEPGRTCADQIAGSIATLKEVRAMAKDWGIIVTIHTAFNTAKEYLQIVEAADSPYVGLCLDTGNSFLVLEDPVDFARDLVPFVHSTHLKDSLIYLDGEGIQWLGGCELGKGTVDLPAIVEMLFKANPQCNLSIEDHWGRGTHPMLRPAFLDSLGPWEGERLSKVLGTLSKGKGLLDSGAQLTSPASQKVDWVQEFPKRLRLDASYAKALRDRLQGA